MSDKDYEIEFSNINERSQNQYLMDYVPDQMIKVYPYRAAKGNKNKPFIQTLTASIIRLSQDVEDYSNLQVDEKGIKYIEMFAAWDEQTKVTVTSGAETFQQDIRKLRTYTALFNNFFKTDDDKPDFFTIGEPFNNVKYKAGTQRVYYGSNFQPSAQELIIDLIDQGYNVNEETRLAEITMQDIAVLEEQYSKSVLLFTLDGNLMLNPTVTYNSKREGKQVTKPGIRLKANSYSLINSIKAKGELDFGNFKAPFADIDFYTEHLFAPIKMSPDKVTDKVTMFADWFDYTLTMPYFLANSFDTEFGKRIQDLQVSKHATEQKFDAEININYDVQNEPHIYPNVVIGKNVDVEKISKIKVTLSLETNKNVSGHSGTRVFVFETTKNPVKDGNKWSFGSTQMEHGAFSDRVNPSLDYSFEFQLKDVFIIPVGNDFTVGFYVYLKRSGNVEIAHNISVDITTNDYTNLFEKEDVMLIEDLILISSGFKDGWKKAPRNQGKPEQIDPEYRVGHKGIRIQNIADKKPADVIDGLILEHEDTYPSFRTSETRYNCFRSVVNALSKYIVSNTYTTNQGFNELNAVTLPWFLMLAPSVNDLNKIDYWTNKKKVSAVEFGSSAIHDSFLLTGVDYSDTGELRSLSNIKWATYSSYFTEVFSQLNDYTFKKGINLTDKLNLSGIKVVETDRKVILPELKETIAENNKINIPGQNTGTEDYLSNYFYLPLNSNSDIEKIFLNGLKTEEVLKPGAKIIVDIPRSPDGVVYTKDQVRDYIFGIYDKNNFETVLDTEINIRKVVSLEDTITGHFGYENSGDDERSGWFVSSRTGRHFFNGYDANVPNFKQTSVEKLYSIAFGIPESAITLSNNTLKWGGYQGWNSGSATVQVSHSEVDQVILTVKQGINLTIPLSTPQLVSRQTYFDKTEWMKFTDAYLMPLGQKIDLYLVSEGDTKINWLEELTIMSVWGDEIRLSCDGMAEELVFTLPSASDETIAVQRIVII